MPATADAVQDFVVVGASLAGLRTVEAARRKGYTGRITLIGAETHLPYDRPPLSKAFLDADHEAVAPPFRTEEHLRDELGVDLRLGAPATALDAAAGTVAVGEGEIRYDRLVIATGAAARSLPGTEGMTGVHSLRTLDDALAIRAALDAGARTVVIGAGFIGSEVASGARKRGLPVTIVESLDVPLTRSVGPEAGKVCADLHLANGTDLRCGTGVQGIVADRGRAVGVRLDDGTTVPADLVVVGIGVVPGTGWLEGSGVTLHERDRGIVCDATLATTVPGVYAAGDVVHWPNPLFDDQVMRLEHWTNAAEHGAAAAAHALEPASAKPVSSVPYFWSDWYGHRIQFVGVPQADEIEVVAQEPYLALYRRAGRIVGALTVDRPTQIMKVRKLIAQRASYEDARAFCDSLPAPRGLQPVR